MKNYWDYKDFTKVNARLIVNTIQKGKLFLGECVDVINVINTLNNRYHFNKSLVFYKSDTDEYLRAPNVMFIKNEMISDAKYVLSIDLHNRIILMSYNSYQLLYNNTPEYNMGNIISLFEWLDNSSPDIPVKYILTSNYYPQLFINIYHDKYEFVFEGNKHDIDRSILEMMFAETQDFYFGNKESKIVVKTNTRHAIYHNKTFICDLLMNDLAFLLDAQDKLQQELENLKEPIEFPPVQVYLLVDDDNINVPFSYNPNEFKK